MNFFVGSVDGVQRVCARMMAILHNETFVTFDFDPSFFSRQITDSDLDQIKLKLKYLILLKNIEKIYCMRFFFVGYS